MKKIVAVVGLLVVLADGPALSQSTSYPNNHDLGAIITNLLRTTGTVTSSQQANLDNRGVACRFLQTAFAGSPSTTFGIQSYDAATNSYVTVVSSGAIVDSTPTEIVVYPGAVLTSAPSGWVANAVPLGPFWRVTQTIAGTSNPAVTGKIGCRLLD